MQHDADKSTNRQAAHEGRRRLNRLAGTALAVADEYRARGNHSRAKAMDEISSVLRDLSSAGDA